MHHLNGNPIGNIIFNKSKVYESENLRCKNLRIKHMKITICGSMFFAKEMLETKAKLEEMGHLISVPSDIYDCVKNPGLSADLDHCFKTNVQKECFDSIVRNDAILVLNYKRNGIEGYVGGATLMEIGIAQALDKKIFLLYSPPKIEDLRYSIEIQLAKPIIINGDLNKIS